MTVKAQFSQHCATLIPRSSPLAHLPSSHADSDDGQVLHSTYSTPQHAVELVNIYAPVNAARRLDFFRQLSFGAASSTTMRIYAGNLNNCPNPLVNHKNQSAQSRVSHWSELLDVVGRKVVNAVRAIRAGKSSFTRPHRAANKRVISWSRIDFVLLPFRWRRSLVSASTLFDAPYSNHRPVTALLRLPRPPPTSTSSLPSTSAFSHHINAHTFRDARF